MIIHLKNECLPKTISLTFLEKKIRKILEALGKREAILGVTLVSDQKISGLNQKYRGKNKPTDVLSFPMDPGPLLGDVVISLETATRQAAEHGHSLRQECLVLLVHGILHLLGYDHILEKDYLKMRRREKFLLRILKD